VVELFRVPLHRQQPSVSFCALHSFYHAIVRPGRHGEAGSQVFDGLVMEGLGDQHAGIERGLEPASFAHRDPMGSPIPRDRRIVPNLARLFRWKILVERASHGNVDQLHAAADPQDREPPLARGMKEGQLELVPPGIHRSQCRGGMGIVPLGIQVVPAGQYQPIEGIEGSTRRIRTDRRSEENGNSSGFRNRIHVRRVHSRPFGSFEKANAAGDADERALHWARESGKRGHPGSWIRSGSTRIPINGTTSDPRLTLPRTGAPWMVAPSYIRTPSGLSWRSRMRTPYPG
jgi:hypothetical protein